LSWHWQALLFGCACGSARRGRLSGSICGLTHARVSVFRACPQPKHRLPVFLVLETAGKTMTPVSYRLNPSAPISLHPMEFRPQFFGDWLRSYVYAGKPLSTVLLCPRSALAFVSLGWLELVSGSIGHTHGRRETGGCCAARRWQRGGLTTAQ